MKKKQIELQVVSARACAGRLTLKCPYCKRAAYVSITILELAKIRVFGERVKLAQCIGYAFKGGDAHHHRFQVRLR